MAFPSQASGKPEMSIKGADFRSDTKWQVLFRIDWFLKFAKIKQNGLTGQYSDRITKGGWWVCLRLFWLFELGSHYIAHSGWF